MQNTSYTTFSYIAKRFIVFYLSGLLFFAAIIFLFDVIELFRRASSVSGIAPVTIFKMAILHFPNILQEVVPFIFLFATIFFFWRFHQTSQLIILRNMGLSIWRLLAPIIVIVLAYSVFEFTVFNPLGAAFMEKFERINNTVFKKRSDSYVVSSRGIWVRDVHESGYALMHAKRVDMIQKKVFGITIYMFSPDNVFLKRVDSVSGIMQPNQWKLENVLVSNSYKITEEMETFSYVTDINIETIRNRFFSPDTLSVWALPAFIKNVENAGLSSINYRFHWYKTLLRPLMFLAMIFFAAFVSYRLGARGQSVYPIFCAILIAFFVYLFISVMRAFAISITLPVFVAAAAPPFISVCASLAALMYLEEK